MDRNGVDSGRELNMANADAIDRAVEACIGVEGAGLTGLQMNAGPGGAGVLTTEK